MVLQFKYQKKLEELIENVENLVDKIDSQYNLKDTVENEFEGILNDAFDDNDDEFIDF